MVEWKRVEEVVRGRATQAEEKKVEAMGQTARIWQGHTRAVHHGLRRACVRARACVRELDEARRTGPSSPHR